MCIQDKNEDLARERPESDLSARQITLKARFSPTLFAASARIVVVRRLSRPQRKKKGLSVVREKSCLVVGLLACELLGVPRWLKAVASPNGRATAQWIIEMSMPILAYYETFVAMFMKVI